MRLPCCLVLVFLMGCSPPSVKSPVSCEVLDRGVVDIDNQEFVDLPRCVSEDLRYGDKLTIWRDVTGDLESVTIFRNGRAEKQWTHFDE